MVVVKLEGGLGNQMFQYAAGRRLASMLQTELKLDVSYFANQTLRVYALHHFHIQGSMASEKEIRPFFQHTLVHTTLEKIGARQTYSVLKEKPFPNFVPEFFSAKGHILLKGYWQSEKYFQDIAPVLKQDFTLREAVDAENADMLKTMADTMSVAIHVRRGDYVSDRKTQEFHGSCPERYYQDAIQHIQSQIKNPHFFVFSDEPEWVTEHFTFDAPVCIVEHNTSENAHHDLELMRHCKHFILANSSFSWWGAWLADHKHKMIIVPQKWFKTLPNGTDDSHIIPETWFKL